MAEKSTKSLEDAEAPSDQLNDKGHSNSNRNSDNPDATTTAPDTGSPDDVEANKKPDDAPTAPPDPNIVDWDGPDDPAYPRNWSTAAKTANVALVSLSVLYGNLATTMFAPGANIMQKDLGFKSNTVEVLTITIGSVGFAIGQLFAGPLSEVFGRMPVYRISAITYMAFTVGCARSTDVAMFLVFRVCTGLAAASYMSTGGGTIADLLPKEKRGLAMAMYTSGPLLGPVIGPIVGGVVAEKLNWRWCFYLVLMLAGAVNTTSFIVMRETSYVHILRSKAKRLRKQTGNPNLRAAGDKNTPLSKLVAHALLRPPRFLFLSPMVALTALYIGLIFGIVMLLFATFPLVFEENYGWSVAVAGLGYIGVGIGAAFGLVALGKLSDRLLHINDGKYKAERRLILVMWVAPLIPVGLFIYGWTARYKVHWVVPIIGTAIASPGIVVVTSSCQAYMIDIFGPQAAASALSAITLLRNMMGAFLPLGAPSLYANLGLGWGNTVLAFVTVAFIPAPFIFYRWGDWLRQKFPVEI
ncbi:Major facilitator superfamily domain, general substrate transporter [Niveomyces insectorum RCEF 264]|uniref:Major facilitator superfamily domain, general substrate transporter n=1 Tax=Niveomyces insectorum RCEF 264 TaxID=1081102 RepID=A0A162L7I4_9HYPO|nr:Major facilitator superfamily domain, general substrate transporter [Niveomyces insectorum RCEF 264]